MSNKGRSIARDLQRSANVAPPTNTFWDMVQGKVSTELHFCPRWRAARIAPRCREARNWRRSFIG